MQTAEVVIGSTFVEDCCQNDGEYLMDFTVIPFPIGIPVEDDAEFCREIGQILYGDSTRDGVLPNARLTCIPRRKI